MIQQTSLPFPSLLLRLQVQRSPYLREQWRSTGKALSNGQPVQNSNFGQIYPSLIFSFKQILAAFHRVEPYTSV